jgi:hypothetical protein
MTPRYFTNPMGQFLRTCLLLLLLGEEHLVSGDQKLMWCPIQLLDTAPALYFIQSQLRTWRGGGGLYKNGQLVQYFNGGKTHTDGMEISYAYSLFSGKVKKKVKLSRCTP